ncbi:MAG: hypothetical protein FWF83_02090 [Clostridiales bacterium]|nr:hypothetical protein [Clostridiales bacterium]
MACRSARTPRQGKQTDAVGAARDKKDKNSDAGFFVSGKAAVACNQSRWDLRPTLLGKLCMGSVHQITDLDRAASKEGSEGVCIGYMTEQTDAVGAARDKKDKSGVNS